MKIDKSTQKCCVTQTIPWTRSFGSNYTLIQKLEYSNCITLLLRFKLSPITHRVCIYAAFRGEIKPNETDKRDSYYT